jgi:hypothetical protein
MVRLPFTRSVVAGRLSTRPILVTRFSEPEGVLPTSAIRRRTGTYRELLRFLVLRVEVTNLSPPSPSSAPSRGRHGLTSRAARTSGEACTRVDRTDSSEGSRRRFGGRSPSSNQFPRTSFVVQALLREAEPLTRSACTGCRLRANAGRSIAEASGSRIAPRRVVRSDGDRGAFHRSALRPNPRIAPRVRPSGPPVHAAPVPRRTPTLCRVREPAPLRPPRDARHDAPSIPRWLDRGLYKFHVSR